MGIASTHIVTRDIALQTIMSRLLQMPDESVQEMPDRNDAH